MRTQRNQKQPARRRPVAPRATPSQFLWTCVAILALVAGLGSATLAQDIDVLVFSTQPGGGALVSAGFTGTESIRVRDRLGFCPGGQCFFSSTDPGYRTPSASRPEEGLYALAPGTSVGFEVVAVDVGVSIKFGATVLDAVGESTQVGEALAIHGHPEYQLQVEEGVVGAFGLSFRLTSTSPQYRASEVIAFTLVNGDTVATQTATPTGTPTATSTPTPTTALNETCVGDCDGDAVVSVNEIIRGVSIALGSAVLDECPTFDLNGDGMVSVDELINAIGDALDGC